MRLSDIFVDVCTMISLFVLAAFFIIATKPLIMGIVYAVTLVLPIILIYDLTRTWEKRRIKGGR